MKKLLSLAIAAAFAATALPAKAEILKNLKTSGEIEVQSLNMHNTDLDSAQNDTQNQSRTRVMYGMNFDLVEDVNAQLSLVKNDRLYGATANPGQNVDNLTANVFVSEAYVNLKNVIGINHKLGRQYYGDPGDLIIYYGPNRFPYNLGMGVTAIDAWVGNWSKDKLGITGIVAKVADAGGIAAGNNSDTDLHGLIANYNLREEANITGYWYNALQHNPANPAAGNLNNRLDVFGLKVKGRYNKFHYKAEYAMNKGNTGFATNLNYGGNAMLANAGYDCDECPFGTFGITAEFARGSGDNDATDNKNKTFMSVNSDYRPGIIFGGTGLVNNVNILGYANNYSAGLSNLTTWNVGAKFVPKKLEKLAFRANYYSFAQTEIASGATYKKAIGTELDLTATWKHSENVSIRGSLAKFSPTGDSQIAQNALHTGVNPLNAATRYGVDLMVKF